MGKVLQVLAKPAPDVPGQWVAHCLNLDLVTQGNGPDHAIEMMADALGIVITSDRAHGLNPFERHQAPEECWQELLDTVRLGTEATEGADPDTLDAIIVTMHVREVAAERPIVNVAPWQIAALHPRSDAPPSQR